MSNYLYPNTVKRFAGCNIWKTLVKAVINCLLTNFSKVYVIKYEYSGRNPVTPACLEVHSPPPPHRTTGNPPSVNLRSATDTDKDRECTAEMYLNCSRWCCNVSSTPRQVRATTICQVRYLNAHDAARSGGSSTAEVSSSAVPLLPLLLDQRRRLCYVSLYILSIHPLVAISFQFLPPPTPHHHIHSPFQYNV